jgi:hypothetical protein
MNLLDNESAKYEPSHALLLTNIYHFTPGSCYLLEQMTSTTELLLRLRIQANDEKGLFKILRREGRKDPELYVQVLRYFVEKTSVKYNVSHTEDEDDDRYICIFNVVRCCSEYYYLHFKLYFLKLLTCFCF